MAANIKQIDKDKSISENRLLITRQFNWTI